MEIIDFEDARLKITEESGSGAGTATASPKRVKEHGKDRNRCTGIKKDGLRCTAPATVDPDETGTYTHCFFHSKDKEAVQAAQRRGGVQSKKNMDEIGNVDFTSVNGIRELLEYTANQLVKGNTDSKKALALVAVANAALKASELDITDDISALKKSIKKEAVNNRRR